MLRNRHRKGYSLYIVPGFLPHPEPFGTLFPVMASVGETQGQSSAGNRKMLSYQQSGLLIPAGGEGVRQGSLFQDPMELLLQVPGTVKGEPSGSLSFRSCTWVRQASLGTLLINIAHVPHTAPLQDERNAKPGACRSWIEVSAASTVIPGTSATSKTS